MKHSLEPDRTIFLVDDNLADRRIIELAVRETSPTTRIRIFANQHILEPLETEFQQNHLIPILVIVDFNLLIGLGTELISQLRSQYSFSHLHIVAMSGALDQSAIQKSYEAGANAFWEKPMNLDKMIEDLGNMLSHFGRFPISTEQMIG